jgi:hypothetical protein
MCYVMRSPSGLEATAVCCHQMPPPEGNGTAGGGHANRHKDAVPPSGRRAAWAHGVVAAGIGTGGRPMVAAWTTSSEYGGNRSSPSTALRSPGASPG